MRILDERRDAFRFQRSFDCNSFHDSRLNKDHACVEMSFVHGAGDGRGGLQSVLTISEPGLKPWTTFDTSGYQRFQPAADFLHVRSRVEGGDAEVSLACGAKAGAGGDDDLGLVAKSRTAPAAASTSANQATRQIGAGKKPGYD